MRYTNLKATLDGTKRSTSMILPLIHTTTAYRLREILPSDELTPMRCPVFNEDLVYLFYGRPAYKAPDGVNSSLDFNWPIVMIFPPEKVQFIERIFPFDTGAFEAGVYESFFHKDTPISKFELPNDIEYAAKAAELFYTNVRNYFFGVADKNTLVDPLDFELQGLQELSRVPSHSVRDEIRRDERSTSIEVQVGKSIKLKSSLHALILPQILMDNAEVVNAVERWKPDNIKFYNPKIHLTTQETAGEIYRIVQDLFEEDGLI